ncbi:dicarboxylate/amino acid:cation symporter [Anaerobranca gottschalkii]|uniref:Na+/H+-dicarboxylate symporter n=1 Tax=Anaerobranca gottschalkii DSM 13577 TaxID=1120990 RepID=A0A1I0APQ4_9FIRM|nr:dicarboxylate/amino acid:cation symporter [Anaerobranca gottschalkii]SES95747.1 Na+/H+-dicarboxylate symporter [Anaerobranca gottschalkii DSM 13577]
MTKLTSKILKGLFLGMIIGLILNFMPENYVKDVVIIDGILYLIGQIFLRAIMMMVVPLVFISLVNGSSGVGDIKRLGRIGGKTLLFYILSTTVAITIGLGLGLLIKPGIGIDLANNVQSQPNINENLPLVEVLLNMVPRNPIEALANGNMLQVIVFAIFTGLALSSIKEKAENIIKIFESLNELVLKMVEYVMYIAPVGVFALMARTFATQGYQLMLPLLKYMFAVIAALVIHGLVVYGGMLKVFTRLSIVKFIKNFAPALSVAFSTASSGATLPVTLDTVVKRLGVSPKVASFTIPLGATINMDGTALKQGIATVFIAQVFGIELTFSAILTVILTATLASIGTAGVPGVGLIMLSMVLKSVGLPVEGIALIMGIDRLLDMSRTAINIMGDAVCTVIISKMEGEFDQSVFEAEPEKEENFESRKAQLA